MKDYFNLGFGDKDEKTGEINDLVITNNGDSQQVDIKKDFEVFGLKDDQRHTFRKGMDYKALIKRKNS